MSSHLHSPLWHLWRQLHSCHRYNTFSLWAGAWRGLAVRCLSKLCFTNTASYWFKLHHFCEKHAETNTKWTKNLSCRHELHGHGQGPQLNSLNSISLVAKYHYAQSSPPVQAAVRALPCNDHVLIPTKQLIHLCTHISSLVIAQTLEPPTLVLNLYISQGAMPCRQLSNQRADSHILDSPMLGLPLPAGCVTALMYPPLSRYFKVSFFKVTSVQPAL